LIVQEASFETSRPGAAGISLVGTRRPAARLPRAAAEGLALLARREDRIPMLVTHHLLRETPSAPGLTSFLSS
jgi:hypothetical protein